MISKILHGISNIIIHGSKWCENVGAGGLQATGGGAGAGPQMIISHKCPLRLLRLGREM